MDSEARTLRDNLINCDFAKTILMLFVIIGHCCAFWTGTWFTVIKPVFPHPYLGSFANWLGSFHVACFTLISGYIFCYVKNERNKGVYLLKDLFYKKARRLLLPYAFMCIFWVVPLSYFFFHYSFSDIISDFILGSCPAQLWFLLMLFDVFILFHILSPLLEWNGLVGFLLLVVFYIVGESLARSTFINFFQIFTAFTYLIVFSTGYYMRKYAPLLFGQKAYSLNNIWFIIFLFVINVVLSLICQYFVCYDSYILNKVCKLLYVIIYVNKAVIAFAVLLYVADRINWKNRIFGVLQKNNFKMYLFHQQVIYFMLYLLNGLLIPEIHALINFVVSSFLSLLLSIIIGRFKILRICFGEI